jgi:DNA-binding transcriptional LysR family regulator
MFRFTLRQLRYVDAAARTGSIANAAAEMNISQSSITSAIDKFEETLGYELFIRVPAKGISTTPSGEEAMRLIRSFIAGTRHFESEMRSVGGKTTGTLRIACYATSAPQVLPRLLKHFIRKYPEISIQLFEGDLRGVIESVENGDADIALTYDLTVSDGRRFEPLFEAAAHAVLPVDDPLAAKNRVEFADLAEKPMIMLELPRTREYFSGLFQHHGLAPNVVHSTRSAEIARALVAGGFGFTILNIRYAERDGTHPGFVVRPIADQHFIPVFGIATMADARPPQIVEAFLAHCRELRTQRIFDEIVVAQ